MIVNESAGGWQAAGWQAGARQLEDLREQLGDSYEDVQVHVVQPERIGAVLREQLNPKPTLLAIGGGDGTIRSVVNMLAGTPHVLGIIPLGTMNRFARSLGIPLSLPAALQVLTEGREILVDLGEANGEVFLNTCWVGLYPEIARMREKRRKRHPHWPRLWRWLVDTLAGAWQTRHAWRLIKLRLDREHEQLFRKVPTVLVTNNALPVSQRHCRVQEGRLAIYFPRVGRGPLGLAWLTIRAVLSNPQKTAGLEVISVQQARLVLTMRLPVALDGEVRFNDDSIELRSRPCAIRILAPAAPGIANHGRRASFPT